MKITLSIALLCCAILSRGQDPQRMAIASENENLAPFYHGVASGDPLPNGLIIWTRYTPEILTTQAIPIQYTIALDTAMKNVVQKGETFADPLNDFTVKIDLQQLNPNTYYYYVFTAPDGRNSLIGRGKTAPLGDYPHFRAATLSCSSIYSGYFNGYARIAERNDLDVVIHTGDYIYDFVDGNGNNRVPDPFPETPKNLSEWRARHYYYELDPDLIKARQQHPFVVVWDNHDVDDYDNNYESYVGANKAFFEWIPMRLQQNELIDTLKVYRQLKFGKLVDLYMLDAYSYKDERNGEQANNLNNDIIDDANRSYLGLQQQAWLLNGLDNSTEKWRILGSQKLMTPWCSGCVPDLGGPNTDVPGLNDLGNLFNPGAWDGYQGERRKIFNKFREIGSNDNIVLSGDAHLAFYADLTDDPLNPIAYNALTGGSVGVEFLPSSLTRENLNEILAAEGAGKPSQEFDAAADALALASNLVNPHHSYTNFKDHGYGLIDVTPEKVTGEFWVSEKISPQTSEAMAYSLSAVAGIGRWSRIPNTAPTPGKNFQAIPAPANPPQTGTVSTSTIKRKSDFVLGTIQPNPTAGQVNFQISSETEINFTWLDIWGRVLKTETLPAQKGNISTTKPANTSGVLFLRISNKTQQHLEKILGE